jgi:hypothetical protein
MITAADYVCFTPKAEIGTQPRNVRFVPKADMRVCLENH